MKAALHEKRERQRKRTERTLERILALSDKPNASRVVGDVTAFKSRILKRLEEVRDPEAHKTSNMRVIPSTRRGRRLQ